MSKADLISLLGQHNFKPYDYDTGAGIPGVVSVRVEFVTKPRTAWNTLHVGLVIRVQVEPYNRSVSRWTVEEALKAIPDLKINSYSRSEKTKRGSGYWSPAKGGRRVHATIERETHSFWVTLEAQS